MRVAILVPTLGRAEALPGLLANIREATPAGSYRVYFVLDSGDAESWEVCRRFAGGGGDVVLVEGDGTYPAKTNRGYECTDGEELILPTADDVVFGAGWYEAGIVPFADPGLQVVGTNDLTPVMVDGGLATMPLVRRSYIEEPGVVFGEPGKVFHEGYHHNAVDRELWELALHRDVARFVPESVIEHRHPSWGTRAADATDQKGNERNREADVALFLERKARWSA